MSKLHYLQGLLATMMFAKLSKLHYLQGLLAAMMFAKLLCLCSVVELQEYYDEHGEYGFRPSRETIEHPNGRGRVEKRVLQASLLHELRLPINLA